MIEAKPSWEEIASLVASLAVQARKRKKKYDWIVSLNRGGLIPGVRLSHILGVKHAVMSVESYTKSGKKKAMVGDNGVSMVGWFGRGDSILIVDDIADSGESLAFAMQRVRSSCPGAKSIDTATIHYKPKSVVEPTFIAKKIEDDIWVVYPWESLEETTKKRRDASK